MLVDLIFSFLANLYCSRETLFCLLLFLSIAYPNYLPFFREICGVRPGITLRICPLMEFSNLLQLYSSFSLY